MGGSPMSLWIDERTLPEQLPPEQAVDGAYPDELAELTSALKRGLPCLVEWAKDLAPYLFVGLRERLKAAGLACTFLDGRPRDPTVGPWLPGPLGQMLTGLAEAVRGPVERRVVVRPHFDLLAS